jgi:hypothetical protein
MHPARYPRNRDLDTNSAWSDRNKQQPSSLLGFPFPCAHIDLAQNAVSCFQAKSNLQGIHRAPVSCFCAEQRPWFTAISQQHSPTSTTTWRAVLRTQYEVHAGRPNRRGENRPRRSASSVVPRKHVAMSTSASHGGETSVSTAGCWAVGGINDLRVTSVPYIFVRPSNTKPADHWLPSSCRDRDSIERTALSGRPGRAPI